VGVAMDRWVEVTKISAVSAVEWGGLPDCMVLSPIVALEEFALTSSGELEQAA
jgi:hypothetical protein